MELSRATSPHCFHITMICPTPLIYLAMLLTFLIRTTDSQAPPQLSQPVYPTDVHYDHATVPWGLPLLRTQSRTGGQQDSARLASTPSTYLLPTKPPERPTNPNSDLLKGLSTNKDTPSPPSTPIPSGKKFVSPNTVAHFPLLETNYEMKLEVKNLLDLEDFTVHEKTLGSLSHYILKDRYGNLTSIFDNGSKEGYCVQGVKCLKKGSLPRSCFCTHQHCVPYVSVEEIHRFLIMHNGKHSTSQFNKTEVRSWSVQLKDMFVEAVFTTSHLKTESRTSFVPLYYFIKGRGEQFSLPKPLIDLEYRVLASSRDTIVSSQDLMATPPGVFCPLHERKHLPSLDNQFSVTTEIILEGTRTIAYEQHSYDVEEKLASYTYRPHFHSNYSDMFFDYHLTGVKDAASSIGETFRVVHDFGTGLQYMIDEKLSNCTTEGIPVTSLDAVLTDNQNIRLRHASELISHDPNAFVYKGTRHIRGVLCDVWVADRGTRKGVYSTVEIYFTHESWIVEVEVVNKKRQIPMGITSYAAEAEGSSTPKEWTSIVHTFFYEYNDGHPAWEKFDISPCLNRINRLFLRLTLQISYNELVNYNLEVAKNSIRNAIASIAGVSPLRISELFLSSRHSSAEVDVWFVLLEKPDISGPVLKPKYEMFMADAYKTLHEITNQNKVSVKLGLPQIKKIVIVKQGSLETTSGAVHPTLRQKSLRFIQAGYTAGSMAGLGFSMAILGTCIGIFIGFLLWKHSPSVPYHIAD